MNGFIARREKEDNLYSRLQKRSIEMLQQLSGKVWSDFNAHDPGVTILDALNYALLELNYKLDFPFEEYLGAPRGGPLEKQGFAALIRDDFFADSIVTPEDYESLITNKVDGIRRCRVTLDERSMYNITLDTVDGVDRHGVRAEVEKLYHAHRNLCENLGRIVFDKTDEKKNKTRSERPVIRADVRPIRSGGMVTGEHHSIQSDFPDCYGVNENGIPVGTTDEHHARIRQLKGYLLIFDYLLGNATAQTAASEFFELSGRTPRYELPSILIPEIEKLIDKERMASAVMEREHFRDRQKSRYLDVLDRICGEDTSSIFTHRSGFLSEINGMRAELISQLPRLHAERFRSFDLTGENPGSISGAKRYISALAGFPLNDENPLTNIFSNYNLKLVQDNHFFGHPGKMPNVEFFFQETGYNWSRQELESVPRAEIVYDDRAVSELRKRINLLWHGVIFESFLVYGSEANYYRIVPTREGKEYLLIFKHPRMPRWINLGVFDSKANLVETANLFWHFLTKLFGECSSFYLLEHILLDRGDDDFAERDDPYTLSIVAPHWLQMRYDPQQFESRITERLPAHLEVRFLWLHCDKLSVFERLYFPWKKTLADGNKQFADRLGFEIRRFLEYNNPSA